LIKTTLKPSEKPPEKSDYGVTWWLRTELAEAEDLKSF
jgi:hypothetical protein